jgi:hypothetical protein
MISTGNNRPSPLPPPRGCEYLPPESDTPLRTHTPACTRPLCMYGHRRTRPNLWWRSFFAPNFWPGYQNHGRARSKQGCWARQHTHTMQHTSSSRRGTVTTRVRACPAQQSAWDTRLGLGASPPHCPNSHKQHLPEGSESGVSSSLHPSFKPAINWGSELCLSYIKLGPT